MFLIINRRIKEIKNWSGILLIGLGRIRRNLNEYYGVLMVLFIYIKVLLILRRRRLTLVV